MSPGKIIIGSRGSRLALIQAESVAARLREIHPDKEFEIRKIVTGGDRNRRIRLDRIEGIGVFVKELEEALNDRRIDLAVHSLKDVPTLIPAGLRLAAVTERLDPRDVLVTHGERLEELPSGSRIGTGSLRRSIQLSRCRRDLEIQSIRGNIDTRLKKIREGELAGVIVAAAALIRLGWEDKITQYLPVESFLPSVGQGALALEVREDDASMVKLAEAVNHVPTWQSISAERNFLNALGGGCRAPIAALASVAGGRLKITGMVAREDGTEILSGEEAGDAESAGEIGKQLAGRLLAMGASRFIAEVSGR